MAGVLALAGCGKSSKPGPTARTPGVVEVIEQVKQAIAVQAKPTQ